VAHVQLPSSQAINNRYEIKMVSVGFMRNSVESCESIDETVSVSNTVHMMEKSNGRGSRTNRQTDEQFVLFARFVVVVLGLFA